MDTEANLTQETEAVEVEPQVEEAVQAEEAVAVDLQPENAESEPSVPEAEEAQADVAEPEAAEAEAVEQVEATEAAAPAQPAEDVVVATDDVAPARSRMELARLAKESLIERAKELADSTDWRKTSDEQRTLMEEWRKIGYAGKEINDKLWADFREARQAFFSRREEEVVGIKKEIIAEAKQLTESVGNWATTSAKLDDLMARWKTAGNSGSDSDKELWDEFNAIRRDFRNRRKADLDKRRATAQANAQAKGEIVAEAKAIAESEEYTRENSDRMRQLDKDYKAIGFAGKPANDTLWEEFSAAKNAYWAANNAHLDERRRQRAERLQEVMDRKEDQIEHLKTQNETLTARLGSTLNPEKLEQIKRWIAQNEERVDDLEDDIGDIRRKI
ncbi:MAG: DUF349 domain-containing protein [Atopobiaceae bacterium]|nr:DUF349 domain-containing protein [Atopobiaceae bacterium]